MRPYDINHTDKGEGIRDNGGAACIAAETDSDYIGEGYPLFLPVLEDVARQEPSLLFNMILVLSRRLKQSLNLIESLSLKEIPQRLATYLVHSGEQKKDPDVFELGFSQRELAKILGTTPETLSRIFKKLGSDEVLSVEGRTIRIRDRQALEELARADS